MSAPRQLRHFEIVDCAVRSAEHFYLLGSHIHQLDEDCGADGGDLAAPHGSGAGPARSHARGGVFPATTDRETREFLSFRALDQVPRPQGPTQTPRH